MASTERQVTDEDRDAIAQALKDTPHAVAVTSCWILKTKKGTEADINDRLLVATAFEVFTIKAGRLKSGAGNRYALVDLTEAVIRPDDAGITLVFAPGKTLRYSCVPDSAIAALLTAYLRLTWARKDERAVVRVEGSAAPYAPYAALVANEACPPGCGILAAYLGASARAQWVHYSPHLYKVLVRMVRAAKKDKRVVLDLTAGKLRERISTLPLAPLWYALERSPFVTHVRVAHAALPNILLDLSPVLTTNPGIVSLSLTDVPARKGFSHLTKALVARFDNPAAASLTELSLPGVPLKDKGLKALLPAFEATPALAILNFKDCSLSPSGLATFFAKAAAGPLLPTLRYLNVSLNKLAKKGTKALCAWLQSPAAANVENLVLNHSSLVISELLDALPAEKGTSALRSLFLGGVSVPDKHALSMGTALRLSAITNLNLLEGEFTPVSLASVVSAYLSNAAIPEAKVNLARTDMAANSSGLDDSFVCSSLTNTFASANTLTRLIVDDVSFSPTAAVALVDALVGLPRLRHFSMCRVVQRKGSAPDMLADALARLLDADAPALDTLWLMGSKKSYFGPPLARVLTAAANTPSLTSLTVADNRIGDDGIAAACAFLRAAPAIRAFSLVGSDLTSVASLELLADVVPDVATLTTFPMPVDDFTALFKKSSKAQRPYLEELIARLRRRTTLTTRPVSIVTGAPLARPAILAPARTESKASPAAPPPASEASAIKRFSSLMLGSFDPIAYSKTKDRAGSLAFAGSGSILNSHAPPTSSPLASSSSPPSAANDADADSSSSASSTSSSASSASSIPTDDAAPVRVRPAPPPRPPASRLPLDRSFSTSASSDSASSSDSAADSASDSADSASSSASSSSSAHAAVRIRPVT